MQNLKNKQAFTLIQLIIVMSVLLVLLASVFLWIDPLARIGTAKDKTRIQEVNLIAKAISEYAADHKGALPILGSVTINKKVLCSSQSGSNLTCDGDSQLCLILEDDFNKYLSQLPYDPDKNSNADSGYYLQKDADNNLIVGSCSTYGSDAITVEPGLKVSCAAYAGGYCWYMDDSTGQDCDDVCAANGKDCVRNVIYGPDVTDDGTAFCHLNKILTNDCVSSCSWASTSSPPYADVQQDDCYIQKGAVTCFTSPGGTDYAICPCQ